MPTYGNFDDADYRMPAKRWQRRNSDGRDTFEGIRTQAPPAFDLEEHDLPMTEGQRPADRETDLEGAAIRHVHVYDEGLEEPE